MRLKSVSLYRLLQQGFVSDNPNPIEDVSAITYDNLYFPHFSTLLCTVLYNA